MCNAALTQPAPQPGGVTILGLVIVDLVSRAEAGRVMYLRQAIEERGNV